MTRLNIFQKTLAPILAAGVILLSGCSKESQIDAVITTDTSFYEVLDSVADENQLDENLAQLEYENDLDKYSKARSQGNIEECNTALANLGKRLIEASVCDHLGIDLEDVVDFKYYAIEDMNYTPNCIIKYYKTTTDKATGDIDINRRELVEEKYYLGEEAADLAFNAYHSLMGHQDTEKDVDDIYKAYQRYLLTTGENVDDDTIFFRYDEDKISKFENIKKK